MTDRTLVRLACATVAASAVLLLASFVLLGLDWPAIPDPITAQAPWITNAVIAGGLGLLIAVRRPRHVIAWLLLGDALIESISCVCLFVAMRGLLSGASASGWVVWPAWAFGWTTTLATGFYTFMIFLFPNGHLPGRRWRPVLWVALGGFGVAQLASMLNSGAADLSPRLPKVPAPFTLSALSQVSADSPTATILLASLLVVLLAGVVTRFRRSTGTVRSQLKLFAVVAGAALAISVAGFGVAAINATVGQDIASAGFDTLAGIVLPLTISVAIMRYGLYDLDVVISRTLVYGSLAVFITVVYVGIAVGIGAAIGGGGKPNLGLSILATAIVAVGFQPVRERVQRLANRLVYGQRATPYEVLSAFSERVAETYAAEDVLSRMACVLQEGTSADSATVWLRVGGELRVAATFPDTADQEAAATRTVEVRHQGEELGALSIVKRRGEALTPIEEKLFDDLAHQAGLVLKNVRLTADLQARLEELRASRQRLVSAQDEERRKLERNLHDGAQQHLVALKVKLGLVEMLLDRDPVRATTTLVQLKADADEALQTLRDLARGIYPPLLADKGLAVALEAQARKATVPVTVEGDGVARYPQEVEATVYFCVLEGLQNAQKYAGPSRVVVTLDDDGDELAWTVADDGCGFDVATMRRGAGLTNMTDRLEALGGSVSISSSDRGTTLQGRIPLRAAATAA